MNCARTVFGRNRLATAEDTTGALDGDRGIAGAAGACGGAGINVFGLGRGAVLATAGRTCRGGDASVRSGGSGAAVRGASGGKAAGRRGETAGRTGGRWVVGGIEARFCCWFLSAFCRALPKAERRELMPQMISTITTPMNLISVSSSLARMEWVGAM